MGISSGHDVDLLELSSRRLKLPGSRTPPTVTLRRGHTSDMNLWTWHVAALVDPVAARKSASLVMYDLEGKPVARYYLENAWPAKIEIGSLKAGASEVLMETVTIVCEHIDRVSV
jgi:phage tail-like protein